MFQQLMIAAMLKAICAAACQFFGYCCDQDDCPFGVCDELFEELAELDESSPVLSPKATANLDFQFNWEELKPLVDAAVAFVVALKAFLGLNKVG